MKLAGISSVLAARSVYSIYNMQSSMQTEDGVTLSWQDHNHGTEEEPVYSADNYVVSVFDRATGEEVASETTGDRSVEISGLQAAHIYDVNISGMNATSGLELASNRFETRTNGQGVSIGSFWDSGASGDMFWSLSSAGACGTGVEFTVPCETNDLISLGVGENVHMISSNNRTVRMRVSSKSGLDHINWVSFGEQCAWGEYLPEQFIISEFSAYDEVTESVDPAGVSSWPSRPGFTTNQVRVDLPDNTHSDCAPKVSIRIPCEVSIAHGGWSLTHSEGSGEYDASEGASYITGVADNDYITAVGVAYEFADDCAHDAEVSITYSVPRE